MASSGSSGSVGGYRDKFLTAEQQVSVDTRSSQVDTRPSFQQISLPDWDSRSTLDQIRSTLVPDSRRSSRH
ncbi:hypothetical protein Taro_031273 [Colocasia esculenta]|uniref:Uncharacterized protein n=1 Tax=Colocasia esculenta TaxID=4460 RepID=A0A843VRG2_COLES|nr:hypothetical protein [Colocasia esculenta]